MDPRIFSYEWVVFTCGRYFFPNKHIILPMLSVYYIRHCKIFLGKINWLFIIKIKWIIAIVSRKHPIPYNPNLKSKCCSLPKLTCLVLNGLKQNPNYFHVKKKKKSFFLNGIFCGNLVKNTSWLEHAMWLSMDTSFQSQRRQSEWESQTCANGRPLAQVTELLQTSLRLRPRYLSPNH